MCNLLKSTVGGQEEKDLLSTIDGIFTLSVAFLACSNVSLNDYGSLD